MDKHVIKMYYGRVLKEIFDSKARGIRGRKERPTMRWLERC
jgi:hypothetical protein